MSNQENSTCNKPIPSDKEDQTKPKQDPMLLNHDKIALNQPLLENEKKERESGETITGTDESYQ